MSQSKEELLQQLNELVDELLNNQDIEEQEKISRILNALQIIEQDN